MSSLLLAFTVFCAVLFLAGEKMTILVGLGKFTMTAVGLIVVMAIAMMNQKSLRLRPQTISQ